MSTFPHLHISILAYYLIHVFFNYILSHLHIIHIIVENVSKYFVLENFFYVKFNLYLRQNNANTLLILK